MWKCWILCSRNSGRTARTCKMRIGHEPCLTTDSQAAQPVTMTAVLARPAGEAHSIPTEALKWIGTISDIVVVKRC
jgi:hypothetical protein